MRRTRTLLILVTAAVTLVALIGGLLAVYTTRRPLPQQEGALSVEGMADAITIYRDAWGVPHVYAATSDDLFFAQGFAHAQDRWWQMEISRRLGHGTLSELLGEDDAVQAADRLARTLDWDGLAQANWRAASDESRAALRAYAAGVNAYIADRAPGDLALEYAALDLDVTAGAIKPWTPLDSLAWAEAQAWQSSGNLMQEIDRALALTHVDEAMLALYLPPAAPDGGPSILALDDQPLAVLTTPMPGADIAPAPDYTRLPLDAARGALAEITPETMPAGSAWVVAGGRTASGAPLLAVAPGGPLQIPSPWYEIGLHCTEITAACPYNVAGLSTPGLPAVVMGHNARIAWGMTGAWVDEQDLLAIRLNPDDPAQYAWDGEWRAMEARDDTLRVAGQDEPLTITTYHTHLGPVIAAPSPLLARDRALVVAWTGQQTPADLVGSLLRLNRARNWIEFRLALSQWRGAASNVLYADRGGNIGYQLAGRVPLRAADHSGLLPVAAEDDGAAWRGVIPFEDLPWAYNPARGYLVTANNAILPDGYTVQQADALAETYGADLTLSLGSTWDAADRAARIEDRLLSRDAHTADTLADIQADTYSRFADALLPYLLDLELDDAALAEMQAWLGAWDRRYAADSPQAALFAAFWRRLAAFTYADELGEAPCDCGAVRAGMLALLDQANHAWWDDVQTRFVVERRDAILRKAFEQAVIDLTGALGSNRDEWQWGALHRATFTGLLSDRTDRAFAGDRFRRGPVPLDGSGDTIQTTRSATASGDRFDITSAPTAYLIVDLADFEQSRAIHMTGQSSHLASPHYDDMLDPWRFVEYHVMLWSRASVEADAEAMLSLEPVISASSTPESTAPPP